MEMGEADKKVLDKRKRMIIGIIVTVLVLTVPRVITAFPRVWHDGMGIRVFSIDRMARENLFARMDSFEGRVLGNHMLETEHGEIRLGRGSLVGVFDLGLDGIRDENFRRGRASHNLVVEGIVMPQNIRVAFRHSRIALLALDRQEVIVSDIFLRIGNINLSPREQVAEIRMGVGFVPEYVSLEDSTQLYLARFFGSLDIYKNDERWVLSGPRDSFLFVKLSGKTDFTRYRSITFRPNWGEFIEGELFE